MENFKEIGILYLRRYVSPTSITCHIMYDISNHTKNTDNCLLSNTVEVRGNKYSNYDTTVFLILKFIQFQPI